MFKLLMGVLILFILTGCDDKDHIITDITPVSDASTSTDTAVTETNISTGTNDKHYQNSR